MSTFREKRRARRIASDEAHAWARNLRLQNLGAKMVLTSLSLYVDGEGRCWVSIPSLADDCEMSPDTVRRRLVWLEEIGAIARHAQWLDQSGRRNGDGHGKRTSDLIQLLLDADQEAIEARAAGRAVEKEANSTAFSPSSVRGPNPTENPVSPSVAVGQPLQSCEGLISEPEPESPLKSPPGTSEGETRSIEESEPDDFGPAWSAYPGREVSRRDLALDEFRRLPIEKQRLCRAAVPLYAQALAKAGRTRPMNFHLWVRTRGFEEFPNAKPSASAATRAGPVELGTDAAKAVQAFYAVGRARPFVSGNRVIYPRSLTPQLLAFARSPEQAQWIWIEDRQQVAAWANFLGEHVLGGRPPLVSDRLVDGETRKGFFAPWPWPPRKDGSIGEAGEAA
jgi:hypothetical protein